MRECKEIEAVLSDYLNRDLPPETCSAIDSHLRTCPECGAAAESLRRTVDMCRSYRADNPPGPLPGAKQQELRAAFERVLTELRDRA